MRTDPGEPMRSKVSGGLTAEYAVNRWKERTASAGLNYTAEQPRPPLEKVLDDYARWYSIGTWTFAQFEEAVDRAFRLYASPGAL